MDAPEIDEARSMSQTIDVTGLPPDAIRAVELLVDILRKNAQETGATQPPPPVGVSRSVSDESYLLRGTPVRYDRPFEPVAPDEWDADR